MKSVSKGIRASTASSIAMKKGKRNLIGRELYVVAVDPGLGGTGVAILNTMSPDRLEDWRVLYTTGSDKTLDWESRVARLTQAFEGVLIEIMDVTHADDVFLISEFPMKMESVAGIAAQKHATMRLAYLVGSFAGMCQYKWGLVMHTVTPIHWKGQLPKKVVEHRIRRALGEELIRTNLRTHAWDAVGIGLWAMGLL